MNRYAIEVRAVKILKPPGIAFFMLIAVSPFLYMVLLSVRDMSEVSESPGSLVPPLDEISFDAYQRVLRSVEDGGEGFTRFIVNSAGLAAGTVVVTLAVSILGATRLEVIRRITLPLAIPAIAATGLFVFMIAWNEFLFALLFLVEERQNWTVSLGLSQLTNIETPATALMAGSVILTLPVVVLFTFAERLVTEGLTRVGVKG